MEINGVAGSTYNCTNSDTKFIQLASVTAVITLTWANPRSGTGCVWNGGKRNGNWKRYEDDKLMNGWLRVFLTWLHSSSRKHWENKTTTSQSKFWAIGGDWLIFVSSGFWHYRPKEDERASPLATQNMDFFWVVNNSSWAEELAPLSWQKRVLFLSQPQLQFFLPNFNWKVVTPWKRPNNGRGRKAHKSIRVWLTKKLQTLFFCNRKSIGQKKKKNKLPIISGVMEGCRLLFATRNDYGGLTIYKMSTLIMWLNTFAASSVPWKSKQEAGKIPPASGVATRAEDP